LGGPLAPDAIESRISGQGSCVRNFQEAEMKLGRLIARLVIGGLFIGHGTQKWFGWFGGPGPDGTEGMMEKLEMRPAKANAHLVAGTETIGGAMIALGALTPVAASGLIAAMITAVRKVHFANGPWNANGGYEFNLVLIGALLAIVDGGPGKISVDSALGLDETGHGWALAALAGGALGSTLAIEAGSRAGGAEETSGPEAAEEAAETTAAPAPAAA
jgi:putative oxidoreductase